MIKNWLQAGNLKKTFHVGTSVVLVFCRYKELLEREAQLEERQREMDLQRQEIESEAQRRLESERELERLKDDNDRWQICCKVQHILFSLVLLARKHDHLHQEFRKVYIYAEQSATSSTNCTDSNQIYRLLSIHCIVCCVHVFTPQVAAEVTRLLKEW